ncbi:MAG TPA: type II secretion system secretin GspD, partial [Steroidobacteraceae bacterium]|nr:type II secretion system secretin GspD [Steroidobacteraceae bacterium]
MRRQSPIAGARRALWLSVGLLIGAAALGQQPGPRPMPGQPGQPGSRVSHDSQVTPNFKDADIQVVTEAVQAATGKTFIIDPRVRGNVTLLSSTPMNAEQFYQAYLAILQVYGFMAVPSGNIIKVMPDTNMRQIPANDLQAQVSSTSDEIVTQVIALRNVSASQLVPVLKPLQPANAQLSAVTGANMLIISDRASNVSRFLRIIDRIDQAGTSDIDVIELKSASAADTVKTINALLTTSGGDASANAKIVADERSNNILVSGDANQRLRVRALVAHLDTPIDSGAETYVRYLHYATAEDLAARLKGQSSSSSSTGSGYSSGSGSGSGSSAGSAFGQSSNSGLSSSGNFQMPNTVQNRPSSSPSSGSAGGTVTIGGYTATILADKETNALIITASARTVRAINQIIDKLDIRRPQVLVEAIIAEVDVDKTADLGVNWVLDGSNANIGAGGFIEPIGGSSIVDLYSGIVSALPSSSTTTIGTSGVTSSAGTAGLSALTGSTLAIGRLASTGINFAAIVRALQGDSRTNIIGTPSVVTNNNQEAKMAVAQEVPFITGSYTGSTGTSSAFQTVQREEVGTILDVTPQINQGDAVLLKIDLESSSLAASSAGAVDLITNKRTISTSVLIRDGATLVLGGLIQDSSTNSEQRVPFLGSIPIIGELFRTRDTARTKTNLIVFIRPHILRNEEDAATATQEKYDYMREQQKDLNKESTFLPAQPFQKITPMTPLQQPPPAPADQEDKDSGMLPNLPPLARPAPATPATSAPDASAPAAP